MHPSRHTIGTENSMDALGAGNLQSGFVLAALLAAVLFVEHIGGSDALARRALQIAVGVLLAFTVVRGTTAFLRQPDAPPDLQNSSGSSSQSQERTEDYIKDVNKRNENANTVHAGIGIILVVVGIAAL